MSRRNHYGRPEKPEPAATHTVVKPHSIYLLTNFMRSQRHYLVLTAITLLVLVIAFLARNYVRETIAPWVLYIFWSSYVFLASIPQILIWAGFMGILLVIAVYSLRSQRPDKRHGVVVEEIQYRGRVEEIALLLRHFQDSHYFRHRMLRLLGGITLQTLGHGERLPVAEAQQMVTTGRLKHLSPEVRQYLDQGWEQYGNQIHFLQQEELPAWLQYLKKLIQRDKKVDWYDPTFEQLVAFLEEELEVRRDN